MYFLIDINKYTHLCGGQSDFQYQRYRKLTSEKVGSNVNTSGSRRKNILVSKFSNVLLLRTYYILKSLSSKFPV